MQWINMNHAAGCLVSFGLYPGAESNIIKHVDKDLRRFSTHCQRLRLIIQTSLQPLGEEFTFAYFRMNLKMSVRNL